MSAVGWARRFWLVSLLTLLLGAVIVGGLVAIVGVYQPADSVPGASATAARAVPASQHPRSPGFPSEAAKAVRATLPSGHRSTPAPPKRDPDGGNSWIPPFLRPWLSPAR
ncbi:hypothetical protein [Fodinicola feengrottensis]|nr:hypothetical protein [Fodinicola feengrottensis]